uniref:Uncharacterized protein n=1 Tax=Lepeophtheirus salmonis TaxID=72036 RepID=A0A0K2SYE9_LEPSM
MFRQILNFYF